MHSFLKWSVQHPIAYWSGCILLSAILIGIQRWALTSKRFVLLPLPSRRPSQWIVSIVLLFRVFPLIMLGVFVVPLAAIVIAVVARRSDL